MRLKLSLANEYVQVRLWELMLQAMVDTANALLQPTYQIGVTKDLSKKDLNDTGQRFCEDVGACIHSIVECTMFRQQDW